MSMVLISDAMVVRRWANIGSIFDAHDEPSESADDSISAVD